MLRKTAVEAFQKEGINPSISFTQRRFLSAFDLHDNKSIALFFKNDATYVNNPGNAIVDIDPEVKVTLCLAYLKSASLSESDEAFINLVQKKREVK